MSGMEIIKLSGCVLLQYIHYLYIILRGANDATKGFWSS